MKMSTTDLIIALILILIGGSWLLALVFRIMENRRSKRFIDFLNANLDTLRAGYSAEFEGQVYSGDSELVQYRWCVSVLVLTLTRSTCLRLRADASHAALLAVVITLFGGWWGIPWGPIHSVESLVKNAGNHTITLREFINQATAQPVEAAS